MYNKPVSYQQQANNNSQTLKIIPKNTWFYTDDFIEGKVELTTSVQVIINDISVSINSSEYWSTFSKESNTTVNEKNAQSIATVNLDVKRKLHITTNLVALKPGKFNFGFKFKAPNTIAPSFEFPGPEGNAYIRYIMSANIISPYIKGTTQIYVVFKTRQKIEMNKQISFVSENNVHKWGLFDGGTTIMKVTSTNGTDNFKFGEDVKFKLNIDNTKGKLTTSETKVVLRRFVVFKTKRSEKIRTFEDKLFKLRMNTPTEPGENKDFPITISLKKVENKNFKIKEQKLPYTNFGDINIFLPTLNTFIMECYYSLKFTLYFTKFVKFDDRPRINQKIIICHQSIDDYRAEVNDNNMNINNNLIGMNLNNNLIGMNNNNNLPPYNNTMNNSVNNNYNYNNKPNNTPINRQNMNSSYPPMNPPNPGPQQGPPPNVNRTFGGNNNNNNINNMPEPSSSLNNNNDFDLPSMDEIENNGNDNNNNNNDNYGNNNYGNINFGNNNNYYNNNEPPSSNNYPEYPG